MKTKYRIVLAAFALLVLSGRDVSSQTWAQQYTLATTPAFQQRVQVAVMSAAIAISTEDPATPNHEQRVKLAYQYIQNPVWLLLSFSLAVSADLTITAASSDAVISTRIAAIWNTFAGVGGVL